MSTNMRQQGPPSYRPKGRVDFGRPGGIIRVRNLSTRWDVRTIGICTALAAAAVLVGLISMRSGDFPLSLSQVVNALSGNESGMTQMVVVQWRLPRVLLAIMFGAALGASGAIFQSLTRNPLGSPDIIGFNIGAYTGVLLVLLVFPGSYFSTVTGAMLGGLGTAVVVYVLAYKRGVQGFRLIVVGIAISAVLGSINTYLILKADLETAMLAAVWGAGSLNGLGWETFGPAAVIMAILIIPVIWISNRMRFLEMGDDAATSLGVRTEPLRRGMMLVGVALIALVTASAGPISFVALAAPQLARRLTRGDSVQIFPSALMGATLLITSDWIAQHAFGELSLPIGVVTVCVGGVYLMWLLAREGRKP